MHLASPSEMIGPKMPLGKLSVSAVFREGVEQGCFRDKPETVGRGVFSIVVRGEHDEDLGTICSTQEVVTDRCIVYRAIMDAATRSNLPLYVAEPLANEGVKMTQRHYTLG